MELKDKVVVITGATRGIGAAIATRCAQAGAQLIVNARHAMPEEQRVALLVYGQQVIEVTGAIDDPQTGQELAKVAKTEFGRIDVLINNAGITDDQLALRMNPDQFSAVINVNLNGTFNVTQPLFKMMIKQRAGVIINMASVVGLMGNIGQANYAASKAGVIGLTKTLAREGAMRGVRVNAIAPGMIATQMTASLSETAQENFLESIPLKRFGTVDEIAHATQFLIENDYVTGQVLTVDGGLVM
ncbi:3-oxoacyl-ACP reductase family protein [Lacticaseibacillus saniviri]|uniref:3-oxoacyl-[acyl-carrier-protein] reductase n=1 Tax=Lacticaseibacillus saniviri JCM 17471 = DSM 24301 TaxID=1293598 RepID=A0A0R2MW18_9LACO|nr:3-oxoacyl-ACP reductase family protein [Lacticaseibacillus saniviri]KRO16432.1 3-oxoacyl-[acyl-carrier-protein] reductase [Lacticaseibacillus saniviri JCM 17471 = DSM 24301]MCG4282543.1 3-oxoacyl-ACP reductase FabG [Lacticaseibacillus saniviri]